MAATARIDELKKRYEENQRRFFAPLANEYRKAGDLEQAIALCRMHLADAPNNISGQIVFGQALYDAGTLDESRTVFETAIGLDPENLIALRHLGDIAKTQLDVPRAREWYQRVLDADRRNEEVLALMEELKTLDVSVQELPVEEVPADDTASAPRGAQSPMSSSASLTGGSETPTLKIEAMAPPETPHEEPEPPPAPEPQAPPAPEPAHAAHDALDFAAAEAEPVETHAAHSPDSSFGFDVDLDAASQIPAAHSDESTTEFGVVELPSQSAFSDADEEASTSQFEVVEPAEETPVVALPEPEPEPVELPVTVEVPALRMPSVLEYVEETPAPPEPVAAAAPPSDELLDFELETPASPEPAPEPAFEAFELTTSAAAEAEVAAAPDEPVEPVEPVEPAPPARRASFESFDPIREMPTPIAPTSAAPEFTPVEPMAAYLDDGPEPPAAPEAFATETMAELYVQQGLRQEAIGVYRQLIAARPDEPGLRARLAELTGETRRPGGSTARAFFANLAGRRATPLRTSVVIDEPPPRRASTPARAQTPMSAPVVEPVAEAIDEMVAEPAPEVAADAMPEMDEIAEAPASEVTTGGTLDALFGHSEIATPDDSAAQALASAFTVKPTPSGRPTRAASDELSLDRVFREGKGTPPKGGLAVPRQSSALRFDQFFTPPPDPQGNAPTSPPPAAPGGESEQFQSWLSGLKKP